ncbi:DUF6268 family outer membrane beta-barrel protein [Flavobacteriaceae bacterium TK19130]|nr:DUF6268 family outer membrane beta-barrel protein [Thermobacterium salinum]
MLNKHLTTTQKNYVFSALLLLISAFTLQAQTTDIARLEYMYIPFSKSDNDIARYRALVQIPIPVGKEKEEYFVIGLQYRYVDLGIEDRDELFTPTQIEQLQSVQRIEGYLGYVFKLNDSWRLGIRGGARINSTLNEKVGSDDVIYEGAVYAINDRRKADIDKPYRLIMGLTYSTTPGRNYPLPMVNYFRAFHPDWTYTVGVPKSNIRRYLNHDHKDALQAFGTLDNFFGNIQNNFTPAGSNVVAENVSMTNVLFGIGYEHFFTKHLLFYTYAAHSVYNEFRLRDNDRETAYIINEENTFYFRGGVKFKF